MTPAPALNYPTFMKKPRIIAFINFKGGVGKTANVVNIGACLAKYHRKKVLIIDIDAQCNATFWLLKRNQLSQRLEDPSRTVYQVFNDHVDGTRLFDFENSVIRGVPVSDEGFPYISQLDILPSSIDLMSIEERFSGMQGKPYFAALHSGLKESVKEYDYVLIDCPPNIYGISKNALYFADYYVVPYLPDFLSLSGFRLFSRLVQRFQYQVGGYQNKKLSPRICAVIINRYRSIGNVFDQSINELKLEMRNLKTQKLIHQCSAILTPYIRDCVRVAECSNAHQPVIIYGEKSIGAYDYFKLSDAFINHIEEVIWAC